MYQFIEKLHTLYELLHDEKSKEIFNARFALDMDHSLANIDHLVSLSSLKDHELMSWLRPMKDVLRKLNREQKKIILYGTALTGKAYAKMLQVEHIDFFGFCGRSAEKFPDGLMGKPVISPDELVAHGDEYYVVLAVNEETSYREISQFLQKRGYPEDHILLRVTFDDYYYDNDNIINYIDYDEQQYFEFPELYRRGTAFIDGGCFDCGTSRKFAEWCGGAYSSIIAFEPDPDNYA